MEYGRRNKTAFRIQVEKGKVQDQIDALLQCVNVTNAFGVLCFKSYTHVQSYRGKLQSEVLIAVNSCGQCNNIDYFSF